MPLIKLARILVLALACQSSIAFASSDIPVPRSKANILQNYKKQLSEVQEKEQALRSQLADLEKELENTRSELVKLAADIKDNESKSQNLETRISSAEHEHEKLLSRLKSDYGSIGNLILALQRIKRVPPEAMLARPKAPLETARSAMLLNSTLPSLLDRAEGLRKDLDRLDELQRGLQSDRKKLLDESRELELRKQRMSGLLDKRKMLFNQTRGEHKEQQEVMSRIARKANDLEELVEKLEQNKKRAQARKLAHKAVMLSPPPAPAEPTIQSKPGKALFPVTGTIRINYGENDELGAVSNGITIDGRSGGVVVAPMDGVVRFAGPFKRFEQLIIVEHDGGYHSLIAGLARIDTVAGRSVQKGEPLGILDDSQASMYYELRRNGAPVNPSVKF